MHRPPSSLEHILIVGSSAPAALENFYARSFRQLGMQATIFDPEATLSSLRKSRVLTRATWSLQHLVVAREFDKFFERDGASYDAVIVFKGLFLTPEVLVRSRARAQARWLNINPDSPFDPGRATSNDRVRRAIPTYDAYLIWSKQLMPRIREAGSQRVAYLPFGFDEANHFPAPDPAVGLDRVVTFVGSHDRQRADALEALCDLPIRIFGNAWNNLRSGSALRDKVEQKPLFDADLRRTVSSSLASINILRPQNAGAHNMRTFEVPAMGGLLLASRTEEQQSFFPENEASLMFGDKQELRKRVLELLAGKHDVPAMKQRALALSAGHSYLERAKMVIALIRDL